MQEILDAHYEDLGKDYDNFVYYSSKSVRDLSRKIIEKLQLVPSDVFADIGCGTGIFPLDILKQMSFDQPIIGVEPYAGMIAQIPSDANITRIVEDAMTFSKQKVGYNKVLVKEMIHHLVDRKEEFLANIYGNLPQEGMLLLVQLSAEAFQQPTFDAAIKRSQEGWLSHPEELSRLLKNTGFQVERDAVECPRAVPKDHYFNMTRGRHMSVLNSFSDEELEAGLAEMAKRYADTEILEFTDRYDYLTAIKI